MSIPRALNINLKTHHVSLKLSENIECARSPLGQSTGPSTGCAANTACASRNLSIFRSLSSLWWEDHTKLWLLYPGPHLVVVLRGKEETFCTTQGQILSWDELSEAPLKETVVFHTHIDTATPGTDSFFPKNSHVTTGIEVKMKCECWALTKHDR